VAGQIVETAVASDESDVSPVKRRHDPNPVRSDDVPGQKRRDRVRDGVVGVNNLDAELLAIHTYIKGFRGKFWVAELDGSIIGCIGFAQKEGAVVELKRLYVARDLRRAGLASKLTQLVFNAACDVDAVAIELWSDTRFAESHAFYLAKGFKKLPETRRLYDPVNCTEYHFIKYL